MASHHYMVVASQAKDLAKHNSPPIRLLIPQGSEANVIPVTNVFTELTGIAVNFDTAPVDDINTQLLLSTLAGEGDYDVALPATYGLPDLVAAKAIIPLTTYARKYEPAGFRSGVLFEVGDSFDDDIYGFQTDGDAYLMFYNRDLLENEEENARYQERFGAPLRVPETWQELDQQMAYFHRPDEGLYGGLLYRIPGYLAWEWWVRFHAKGIWPLSKSLEPQINSDEGVEALEELIEATNYLVPEVRSLGLFENWERFGRGDVYCNIGWGGSQKYLNGPKSQVKGKMTYGPTPGGIVNGEVLKTPYFNWGWNYVVTSNSNQPELAYLFALFASTAEMSTLAVRQSDGFFDPIREEHYQDPKIENIYSREFLTVHETSLKSAIPDLYLANQGEYFKSLSVSLDKALSGKLTPKDALDRAAYQWRLINRRSNVMIQTKRWLNLRARYPANARSRLRDLD